MSSTQPTRSLIEIHSAVTPSAKKRRPIDERMTQLDIEGSDYERYEEMFLRSREKGHFITRINGEWREVKHPWGKNHVLRHLTGERTIGLFPAARIDYLMIDIDRHNEEEETLIRSRVNQVIEVMRGDPLIYQSSFSGGIRLCFFLPVEIGREALLLGCKSLFQHKGVVIKRGSVEIMAKRTGDRLPFGEGSYLVDPYNLEPIYHLTPRETILQSYRAFQYQKVDIPFTVHKQNGILVPDWQGMGVYNQVVSRLLDHGLCPETSTTTALMKLSWDLIVRKGYSKEETERYLVSWIREKHNGLSNRGNQGRIDDIFRQIERIVQRTDPGKARYSGSRYAVRKKKLSLSDLRKIVSMTDDRKLQLALFSLLEYCLNFGKTHSGKTSKKTKISNLYVSENGHVTYVSGFQTDFYCEVSQQTLRHLNGFDKANPQTTMQQIEKLGVISLKRRAHPRSHSCRHYWVHFRFNEDDPIQMVSLEEGLAKLRRPDNRGECSEKTHAIEGDKSQVP